MLLNVAVALFAVLVAAGVDVVGEAGNVADAAVVRVADVCDAGGKKCICCDVCLIVLSML